MSEFCIHKYAGTVSWVSNYNHWLWRFKRRPAGSTSSVQKHGGGRDTHRGTDARHSHRSHRCTSQPSRLTDGRARPPVWSQLTGI